MYMMLFHAITDAVSSIEKQNYGFALERLIKAQQMTEETYIRTGE
jgi:hypothetical protein